MKKAPKWLSWGYILLFACLPWSVEADFGSWGLSLPSEPLIAVLGLGLLWSIAQDTKPFLALFKGSRFWQIALVWMAWMAITTCFSTLSIVSWKYFLVTAAHVWVFGVGIALWPKLWDRAFPYFAFSMGGVAIYTLIHHGFYHFRSDQALLAPMPFFPEHTMWAAALVMVLFLLGIPAWQKSVFALKSSFLPNTHWRNVLMFTLLVALIFSTARAAWVSVFGTGLGLFLLFLGNKNRVLVLLGLFGLLFWIGRTNWPLRLDVSALERLNRWSCAFRMAKDRPLLGFGPGTFQFQYLDYQRPAEMTRISVTEPVFKRGPDTYGRGGGAHSEYLRLVSESGWSGLLLWLGLLGALVFVAEKRKIIFYQPYFWAILSFLIHGLVNDFLHDTRLAALVWGCFALISVAKKED